MSCILRNGYSVQRVSTPHIVNGTSARSFIDATDKVVVVTDTGDPDELVSRTAEGVEQSYIEEVRIAQERSRQSAIEVLHGLLNRTAPLIPDDESRLPFARPSGL